MAYNLRRMASRIRTTFLEHQRAAGTVRTLARAGRSASRKLLGQERPGAASAGEFFDLDGLFFGEIFLVLGGDE